MKRLAQMVVEVEEVEVVAEQPLGAAVDVQMVAQSHLHLPYHLLLGKLVEAPLALWAALVDAVEKAMACHQYL